MMAIDVTFARRSKVTRWGVMPGNLIARHAGRKRQARQAGRGHDTTRVRRR